MAPPGAGSLALPLALDLLAAVPTHQFLNDRPDVRALRRMRTGPTGTAQRVELFRVERVKPRITLAHRAVPMVVKRTIRGVVVRMRTLHQRAKELRVARREAGRAFEHGSTGTIDMASSG